LITSKSLWRFVALTLIVLASNPAIAGVRHDVVLMVASEAVGQTKDSRGTARQEVESLLSRARQAIKQGDLETAESLIVSAEKLGVPFSVFHLGDTPRKVRADLMAAQRARKKKKPERPSQKFTPKMPSEEPADPVTAKRPEGTTTPRVPTEILDPRDEPPLILPQGEGRIKPVPAPLGTVRTPEQESANATVLPEPTGNRPDAADGPSDLRRQSDFHLQSARRALAVGDVRRAAKSAEAAKQLGVQYGFHDDTPDKVAAAIHKYSQVIEQTAGRQDEAARRQLADVLMDQAQQLLRWKDYDEAERLVRHVEGLHVNYGPFEVKPEALAERIAAARSQKTQAKHDEGPIRTAAGVAVQSEAAASGHADRGPSRREVPTARAVYNQNSDTTRNQQAAAVGDDKSADADVDAVGSAPVGQIPASVGEAQPIPDKVSDAMQLFKMGEQALKEQDRQGAIEHFRQAYQLREQLDAATAQRLQDHMLLLSAPPAAARGAKPELLLDNASAEQALLVNQVSNDLAKKLFTVDKVREKDPKRALEILKEARVAVVSSGIDTESRGPLLRRIDRKVVELDKYIIQNRAKLELEESNREILKEVDRRQQMKLEVDDALAKLVDDFNKLMDEQRFAEAEVLAKRARELAPENPIVKQLIWQSKFVSRTRRNETIGDAKENGFWTSLENVDESAIPFDDNEPYRFGDARTWKELTDIRGRRDAENRARRSERELEIERRLKTPVSLQFRDRPLSEVLEHLAKLAAVNLHLDPQGLEEEGVSSDTPVTIDLTQDISLKSALNLILEPLHLDYVIKDEVLKITSEQLRQGEVVTKTYDVADLVIPIPNFGPNGRTGMPGAIAEAYNMTGTGVGLSPGSAFVASQDGTPAHGVIDPAVLAQINNQLMPGGSGGGTSSGMSQPLGHGPGGLGGGAQADFDSLIELITTTVKPTTWDEVGGPGSIQEFRNNLSLVISQTEDVHAEIVDLLEQLRRNQDLQVTIEVRFITLSDTFFERIGVDFDFNVVNSSATIDPNAASPKNKREIVGLNPPAQGAGFPNFTGDLSIPFRQESFDLAVPQFGTPVPVANFGFAILSDLEAFLLVQAAQGDRRSNVLQAPKVTLFNGQLASVFDQTQMPFVISVIPVVGDFAAAYQPVITVLSEGTALTVQAIISHDRRFVRLTVLPLFSQIGDVTEFTFSGSKTSTAQTSASNSTGETGDSTSSSDDASVTSDGVTVQLPNFSFVSVTTTVSVPDGGTVLLGGIKRLSEGRNEFGVPLLSKLPYINRLFTNVGIGRETQSLMMMVTPRIIIQEEEEERLGITPTP
jgi:general secretion pathway protein D